MAMDPKADARKALTAIQKMLTDVAGLIQMVFGYDVAPVPYEYIKKRKRQIDAEIEKMDSMSKEEVILYGAKVGKEYLVAFAEAGESKSVTNATKADAVEVLAKTAQHLHEAAKYIDVTSEDYFHHLRNSE